MLENCKIVGGNGLPFRRNRMKCGGERYTPYIAPNHTGDLGIYLSYAEVGPSLSYCPI